MAAIRRMRDHLRNAEFSISEATSAYTITEAAHLEDARDSLARALMAGIGVPRGEAEYYLVNSIACAIADTAGDLTPDEQARHIVNELFKHLKPEEGE